MVIILLITIPFLKQDCSEDLFFTFSKKGHEVSEGRDSLTLLCDNIVTTVYNATKQQCNSDYLTTASGFKLDTLSQYQHRIMAVSRDLLNNFNYGDTVYIVGTNKYDGYWIIHDTMNKRYTNYIDLLIDKDMPIGKWYNVKIFGKLR